MSELSREDFQLLMAAVQEAGSVQALLRLASRRATARTRIEPRTAAEVVSLVAEGIISRQEGRRFLGLRGAAPARRPR